MENLPEPGSLRRESLLKDCLERDARLWAALHPCASLDERYAVAEVVMEALWLL